MSNDDCSAEGGVESLQASLFELGASPIGLRPHKTTPHVAQSF